MNRSRATAILISCLIAAAVVASSAVAASDSAGSEMPPPASDQPQAGRHQPANPQPRIIRVRARYSISHHFASYKMVVRTRHVRRVRCRQVPGLVFKRKSRNRFVVHYGMVAATNTSRRPYSQTFNFRLKAQHGNKSVWQREKVRFRYR